MIKKTLKIFGIIFVITFLIMVAFVAKDFHIRLIGLNNDLYQTNKIIESYQRKVNFNNMELLSQIQDLLRNFDKYKDNLNQIKEQLKNQLKRVSINDLLNSSVLVQTQFGSGSGTLVKKSNTGMLILTCYHVVEDAKDNEVMVGYSKSSSGTDLSGMVTYKAKVMKINKEKDLALLKIDFSDSDLVVANIAKLEPLKGDIVYSVGNPLGLIRTISKGILSNKQDDYFVSDNTITFGNSGGGLFNSEGELIGVPARVLGYPDRFGYFGSPESSLGMSINLQTIKDFLRGEI